ncbi:N-acetyltransferase 5 [Xylona heveae TC161]|uniref:N-acetyltransferase 5 n=1 Tax=Xylona heveae (strain CBS 132557 / TC161) TaxID=1328760 RepID=A0A165IMS5_XYLHT|nr:N-acetyltransferase 5 [Xylona heveae TC161]KZF25121.1 N-acetyltransferase 5 [Xylona heveae TC161]
MAALRPFHPLDLFKFNHTNLDPLTENYGIDFYFSYLAKWPSLFNVIEGADGKINAYMMGKLESSPPAYQHSEHALPWHAHITALTVAPSARRLGLAQRLTSSLEKAGDEYNAWFVDLFVRESNQVAQSLYKGMGYSVFRRVVGYYSDNPTGKSDSEDSFDMRKPLKRDKKREHIRENGENFPVPPDFIF